MLNYQRVNVVPYMAAPWILWEKKSGDVIVDSLTDSSYSSCTHHHGIITTPHQIHLQHPAATLLLFKIAAAPKILAFGIPQLRRTLRITTFLQECRLPTS
jgi:hypothetical protein